MKHHLPTGLFILILSAWLTGCFLSPQQDTDKPTITADSLTGRTFAAATSKGGSRDLADAEVSMIFNKDTTGMMRAKKGAHLDVTESSWGVQGDHSDSKMKTL